jgi:excinuclease UvrABC ATPase subunit
MRICQAGAVNPAELGTAVVLPDPALVVLAGASGSGKSVWAVEHYRQDEVVSYHGAANV